MLLQPADRCRRDGARRAKHLVFWPIHLHWCAMRTRPSAVYASAATMSRTPCVTQHLQQHDASQARFLQRMKTCCACVRRPHANVRQRCSAPCKRISRRCDVACNQAASSSDNRSCRSSRVCGLTARASSCPSRSRIMVGHSLTRHDGALAPRRWGGGCVATGAASIRHKPLHRQLGNIRLSLADSASTSRSRCTSEAFHAAVFGLPDVVSRIGNT